MAEVRTEFTGDTTKLENATKRAEKAISDVSKTAEVSSKKIESALNGAGDAAGKMGGSAQKLSGVLNTLSPSAGSAAGAVNDMGDVLEVATEGAAALGIGVGALTAALAVAATVLAVGYVGWKVYNDENERAIALATDQKIANDALIPGLEALEASTQKLKVATGEITQSQADFENAQQKAFDSYNKSMEASIAKIAELHAAQNTLGAAIGDLAEKYVPAWTPLGKVVDAFTTSTAEAQEELDILTEGQKANIEQLRGQTENNKNLKIVVDENTKATKRASEGSKAHAEKLKAEAAALKAATDAEKAAYDIKVSSNEIRVRESNTIQDQIKASHALAEAILLEGATEDEVIAANYKARDEELQAQIQRNRDLKLDTAELEQARVALREETKNKYKESAQKEVDIQKEANDKILQATLDRKDKIIGTYDQILSGIGSIASEIGSRISDELSATESALEAIDSKLEEISDSGKDYAKESGDALVDAYMDGKVSLDDLSSAQKKAIKTELEARKKSLKEKEKAEKDAALYAFRIQQAAAISQTIISTIQGAMAAFQLGPVAGAIAAGAITALGAGEVALIASEKPKLHTGGEVQRTLTVGEAVLNERATRDLGSEAITDLNAGRSLQDNQPATIVYKHKAFEYFMRDNIKLNGVISQTIRKGDRVGQIRRGRG